MPDTTVWWAVISSDDLLDYLRQAHNGDDPSDVLARLYLDADERMNVRPTEEDEDFEQEKDARRNVEDENAQMRRAIDSSCGLLRQLGGMLPGDHRGRGEVAAEVPVMQAGDVHGPR